MILTRSSTLMIVLLAFNACNRDESTSVQPDSACKSDDNLLSADAVCLQTVSGRIVDEEQLPVEGQQVTVCGPICFIGETEADGSFLIEINRLVLAAEYSVQPHGRPSRSSYYFKFPTDFQGRHYDAGVLPSLSLEPGEPLITWRDDESGPAQSVQSAGFYLEVPEGVQVRPDIGDLLLGAPGQQFSAVKVTPEAAALFDPFLSGKLSFALAPFETRFTGVDDAQEPSRAGFQIENSENWPAKSQIDVYALGTYLDVDWLTPAEFEFIGQATVSDDEKKVVFTVNSAQPGLQHLTWVSLELSE